jgi:hypothetical protein
MRFFRRRLRRISATNGSQIYPGDRLAQGYCLSRPPRHSLRLDLAYRSSNLFGNELRPDLTNMLLCCTGSNVPRIGGQLTIDGPRRSNTLINERCYRSTPITGANQRGPTIYLG